MRKLAAFVFVALLFFVSVSAWAQGTTSRVVGVVSDASGAVVPGSKVTLTNEATGVSFSTETTAAGNYVFEAVQVGSYKVEVEAAGFKKFTASGNRLTIGAPLTVNVALQVGVLAETVEVSGAAEVVSTSSSGNFGSLVEQRVLQDLPIVGSRGRNPLDLVLTQPGVVAGANTGGGYHVHGARDRAWNFTLDGIDNNETSAGGSNFSPLRTNPDSLAEFRVITSNATAEYGRNSGAQVAMVTRSGSNNFHGSGFEFYRTPRFNANEWENNINRVGKRQFVQHIPGFEVGGPIRKNKTFFFTNFQWLRAYQSGLVTRTVYTAQARQGIFRYVKGGRNQPAGVSGASVDAAGNVLPGLNIGTYDIVANDPERLGYDPTMKELIQATPLPNNFTGGDGLNTASFTFVAPEHEKQHDTVFKFDHVFNARNFFYARIAWGRQDTVCDSANGGQPIFPGLGCFVNTERNPRNLAFNWRWNPTPRITNELVVGGNHFTFNFDSPYSDPNKLSIVSTQVSLLSDFERGNLRTLNTYQVVENFSYVRGAHNFKMGANIRYQQHVDTRGSVAGVNVNPWANLSTSVNTVDPVRFGLPTDINTTYDRPILQSAINTLLGRVGIMEQGFVAKGEAWAPGGTPYNFDARFPEYDFYWQDNWKMKKNLTVDVGLRWEAKLAPRNPDGRVLHPNQVVAAGAAPSNTLKWVQGSLHNSDWNNLGPSLGLAWDPKGNGKQSIRANYRLAYDRINTFVLSSSVFQSLPGITYGVSTTEFGQAGGRLRNVPKSLAPAASVKPADFAQPAAFGTGTMTVLDPSFQAPKTNMWGLSLQRELWKKTVFDVSYIGRHAVNLFGAYNVNQALYRNNGFLDAFNVVKAGGQSDLMNRLLVSDSRRSSSETGSDMVRRLYQSDLNLNNVASVASSIATRLQGGRSVSDLSGLGAFFFIPFPQFSTLRVIDSNDFSTYHALELKLERRFSQGLGFLFAYTFSKSLDDRSFDPAFTTVSTGNAQSASSTPFDIYNRRLNYARSDFDRTHVFQGSWVYELPFGRGKRFANTTGVLDRVLGGWEVTGFITRRSGRPFTVYAGAYSFNSVVQATANCNGCARGDGYVFDDPANGLKWFFDATTRAKFSTPAAGQQGNTARNMFDGPPSFNIDMGILKRTRITERQSIEYRADFTNFTNTPTFGFPTLTTTSSTFGRIRDTVSSYSRKLQMGIKYRF
jgi:hypothetical protein